MTKYVACVMKVWKCNWFQFISSEDKNVSTHKLGEGLDYEGDPREL